MGTEALIERLADLRDAECRGAPMALLDDFAAALKAAEAERVDTKQLLDRACEVNIQIQAEREKAESDLTAARAEAAEWKRHYDKATERLAAYSRDFAAEHKSLTAARAQMERLREGLRPALNVVQQITDPKQFASSSQHVWAQAVEAEAKLRALLGEQGK